MDNFSKTGYMILNAGKQSSLSPIEGDETRTFQEAVLNKVSEGLCVCHNIEEYPFVRFTIWNERMTTITGYSLEEINRLGWYQAMYPDPEVRNRAIARMDEMRTGNNLIAEEWIITSADESKKIVEITTSVLGCDKGRTHVFGMIEDVTEKRVEQQRREKLREQMARADRMESLGLLAGGVAHDLNNMLGPVIGYADLLLREMEGEEKKVQKIQRIKKSATDAADVVQDLLTLARRGRCDLSPVNLTSLIQETTSAPWYQHLCEVNPEIHFEVKIREVDVNILASASHIKKALMNLVRNAVEAMPTGGTLTIEAARVDAANLPETGGNLAVEEYVGLTVRDTGYGIEPDMLPKIFEPYYSKKPLSSSSGSGLGLAVVYGVVKDHSGVYDIKSTVGKGTDFTLFFPLCSQAVEGVIDCVRDHGGNETILVVDDDDAQRDLARDMLGSLGYNVLTAENGQQAIEMLCHETVDLVVLDMIMENGYDGLDTFEAIRKLRPLQRAIIVTGYSETNRVKKACELGVLRCIRKPYSLDSIGKVLKSVLT